MGQVNITDMMEVLGALSDYALASNNIPNLDKSYQIPRTSIIMTSVEEHFAPLDATVGGLGLILVPEINYCDNICFQVYKARQSLKLEKTYSGAVVSSVVRARGSVLSKANTTANRLVAIAPPRKLKKSCVWKNVTVKTSALALASI